MRDYNDQPDRRLMMSKKRSGAACASMRPWLGFCPQCAGVRRTVLCHHVYGFAPHRWWWSMVDLDDQIALQKQFDM